MTAILLDRHDILFFWVARMVMMGIEFTGNVPFSYVYLHGLIRDSQVNAQMYMFMLVVFLWFQDVQLLDDTIGVSPYSSHSGRKMSKTLGNVIDPLDMVKEYGSDALRFTLALGTPGQDLNLSIERLTSNKAFTNKLWNAGKFVLQNLPSQSEISEWDALLAYKFDKEDSLISLPLAECWVVSKLHLLIDFVTTSYDKFSFGDVARETYDFFWGDFADWYIEASKARLYQSADSSIASVARAVLLYVFENILKILHPFMPFVTEELWQALPHRKEALMVSSWPETTLPTVSSVIKRFENLQALTRAIRNARAEYSVQPAKRISATIVASPEVTQYISREKEVLALLSRLDLQTTHFAEFPPGDANRSVHLVASEGLEAYLPLADMVDITAELERLCKRLSKMEGEYGGLLARLSSSEFLEKAPEEVVRGVREKAAEMEEKISLTKNRIGIGSLRKPITSRPHLIICNHQFSATHSTHEIIASMCNSLREGLNWESLSRKYDGVELDSSMVEQVLLQLKEPVEAKRALSFFHWASHRNKLEHGIRPYCIAIHILCRARLVNDARALLQSLVLKNGGCRVVGSMVGTYKVTNSSPFVFDMLVQCCSKLRMLEGAFDVCCYLDEHGFSLSLITFNALLHVIQKSSSKENHMMIWKVYGHMIEKRVYPNEVTVRIMISALCKEGELQKVVDVLDRIQGRRRCSPTEIVSTSMILRMLGERRIEQALVLLKRMLQKNMILDTISFSLMVFARIQDGELGAAWELYEEMLQRGFTRNAFVHTLFIGAYCEKGMVDEACGLMQEMTSNVGCLKPYESTYSHLIAGCAVAGKVDDGIIFCNEMMNKGMAPSCSSFNLLTARLCERGSMKQADDMLTLAIEKVGFVPDELTYSHLMQGYSNEGKLQEVLKLYYEIAYNKSLSPGLPIFLAIIKVLCHHGKPEEAERHFLPKMKQVNVSIYEALITGHLEKGNEERARVLHREMVEKFDLDDGRK
ncbi:hypothetical protein Dimus_031015 [Dionaea muscipula]